MYSSHMKLCALIAVIATFAGSASAAPKKILMPASPTTHTASPAPHTAVLPLSEGPQLPEADADSYWTPHAADLRRMEKALPPSLAGYYRQYIGIFRDGKRLIYINGFSSDVAPEFIGGKYDWHRHAISVMDGGTGFFDATYDPQSRKFTGPRFHGLG